MKWYMVYLIAAIAMTLSVLGHCSIASFLCCICALEFTRFRPTKCMRGHWAPRAGALVPWERWDCFISIIEYLILGGWRRWERGYDAAARTCCLRLTSVSPRYRAPVLWTLRPLPVAMATWRASSPDPRRTVAVVRLVVMATAASVNVSPPRQYYPVIN